MKLRIVSNPASGVPELRDAETGALLRDLKCTAIRLQADAQNMLWQGQLTVVDPEVNIVVDAELLKDAPVLAGLRKDALIEWHQLQAAISVPCGTLPQELPVAPARLVALKRLTDYLGAVLDRASVAQAAQP